MKRKGAPKHQAQVRRGGGKSVHLGHVVAAKEAMLQQAREEGLTLRVAKNITGYFCVYLNKPGQPKPYQARVRRGGKQVSLGSFATAEEAALCIARSPEGRAATQRAAAASPPPSSEEEGKGIPAMPTGAVLKEEGVVPAMPPGAYVKEEEMVPPLPLIKEEEAMVPLIPPDAIAKVDDEIPPMPSDAVVKHEPAVVVKEEESSDGRPKRQRMK